MIKVTFARKEYELTPAQHEEWRKTETIIDMRRRVAAKAALLRRWGLYR
jgi:hypothetical protein